MPAEPRTLPLWPLPLAAALLPLAATVTAFQLSVQLGLIPPCNPLLEGCVSISRAARHESPNVVFRLLVAPAALAQAACWLACRRWLGALDAPPMRGLAAVPWLGAAAGVALLVYTMVLGVEGPPYRVLRRAGTVVYFGFTCLAMLVVAGAVQGLAASRGRWRAPARALVAAGAALPLLGIAYAVLAQALEAPARDALENVAEWWAGLAFTLYFVALAWAWRATRFALKLEVPR